MPSTAAFFIIMLPWLNPFAPGPMPAAVPLLFSWACAAALLGICSRVYADRGLLLTLMPTTAWAWLAAGLLSSAIGLWQYFGSEANLSPWINQTEWGQAFANLRQRNQFASLTNIALTALLWLALTGHVVAQREWLIWAAAGLLAAGNAASSSRTGLVQLIFLCMLCWIWCGWRQRLLRRVLLAALFSYAVATALLPWLAGLDPAVHGSFARLRSGDPVCASRLTLWSNVLQLIGQKPWMGWGWGELDHAHYRTLYPGARFCDILDNAHNLPLHLAVELGIPVALAFCGLASWIVWRAKPWRERDATRQLAWGVLAIIMLHSMLEYPLWYGPFQMAAGLCLWMLWSTSQNRASGLKRSSQLALIAQAGLAGALLVAITYAAWDYHRVSQIYRAPGDRDKIYREDTMDKIRGSWLFRNQVQFAALTTTPLTRHNAQWTFDAGTALLHYSPEPRVIEKVIESAVMLNRDDEALLHIARYRAAFPQDHAKWRDANAADSNGRSLF